VVLVNNQDHKYRLNAAEGHHSSESAWEFDTTETSEACFYWQDKFRFEGKPQVGVFNEGEDPEYAILGENEYKPQPPQIPWNNGPQSFFTEGTPFSKWTQGVTGDAATARFERLPNEWFYDGRFAGMFFLARKGTQGTPDGSTAAMHSAGKQCYAKVYYGEQAYDPDGRDLHIVDKSQAGARVVYGQFWKGSQLRSRWRDCRSNQALVLNVAVDYGIGFMEDAVVQAGIGVASTAVLICAGVISGPVGWIVLGGTLAIFSADTVMDAIETASFLDDPGMSMTLDATGFVGVMNAEGAMKWYPSKAPGDDVETGFNLHVNVGNGVQDRLPSRSWGIAGSGTIEAIDTCVSRADEYEFVTVSAGDTIQPGWRCRINGTMMKTYGDVPIYLGGMVYWMPSPSEARARLWTPTPQE